jgi:predicted nucleic acid-binding protein
MARRRIVPDNSVLIAALFHEPLTPRATRVLTAIHCDEVVGYATDYLRHEFMSVVYDKATGRSRKERIDIVIAQQRVFDFLSIPLVYVPGEELDATRWDLIRNHSISPQDSWYVACAIHHDAELWISHQHRNGLIPSARRVHDKVFLLSEQPFSQ